MAIHTASNDAQAREGPTHRSPSLVVGIGASAGGITALKGFFGAASPSTGMAYVVILHLSPDHESNLSEVLQATTTLPVAQVNSRVRMAPDHVYVVPPNRKLTLTDGHIEVSEVVGTEERRAPIDIFLRTLGDAQQERAVSVILSGTGADGSMGLKRVKECGGICLVQDPSEAEFDDMPRAAIATGLIDYVMPVSRMPGRLSAYRQQLGKVSLPVKDDGTKPEPAILDIFTQLRTRTGHDFSTYKRSTVLRRIERRMNVHGATSVNEYLARLRDNREEAHALLKDLLISVTNFFRDPEAFAYLEREVVPKLFAGKGTTDHVRAWVAGCATGEEAYSIAMLLAEHLPEGVQSPTIQVFATDIDAAALAKARTGLYTLNDAADVSPERLRRFFLRDGDGFRVRRELREMVLFASHNVLKDPPFSHLDLVTCRNLLIYLNRAAQERVLKLFHFGLNPGGYLFLGTSESADDIGNLFVSVDKQQHIFQGREMQTPMSLPAVSATSAAYKQSIPEITIASGDGQAKQRMSYRELHQRLLEHYAAPSVVVNEDYEILHLTERAGRFLQFVGGEPSQNLLQVVRPELRLELHSALYNAVQRRTVTEAVAGPFPLDGEQRRVKLIVSPVFGELDTARGMILVLFEVMGTTAEAEDDGPVRPVPITTEPIARQLEEELVRIKLQLRSTVEQYELQQEELKASNEELQAMNEELRSSTEELETSKEELQSVNEELTTVNQELKIKIDELSHANNDMRNLMNSTDLATIFVDRSLRIKLFTPRARPLFNLIPTDVGRPFSDINHRLVYPEMKEDVEKVLDTLTMTQREIASQEGLWYIARVLPYRTAEDRISGVVLTFTDITQRVATEQALRESEERGRLMIESVPEFAIFTVSTDGMIESWNAGAQQMFGYTEGEIRGQPLAILFTPEDRAAGAPAAEMRQARESGRGADERWHLRKDGARFFVSGILAPLLRKGTLVGYTKVARDLTHRKASDDALREVQEQLESRVQERTGELAAAHEALRRESGERLHAEQERVQLLRQLVGAQEEERNRISRELHDQLGQEVTALGLKLAALRVSPEVSAAMREQIVHLESLVKELDSDVEFLVWQLRPTGLSDLGLAEALKDYAGNWSRFFEVAMDVDCRLGERLPGEMETVLYRIAQEALNNVAKHARAEMVSLRLTREAGHVVLAIADDGVGFAPKKRLDQRSLGLVGMRERAALVGGTVTIESGPREGTRVVVRVPL